MNELGIERLGTFGMPPVELVGLAADLGCDCVGIGLAPAPGYNPDGHAAWSLRDDPAQRRETMAACRDRGVRIAIVEGYAVTPGKDMRDFARDLDLTRELGCDRVNVVSIGKDMSQAIDGFAALDPALVGYVQLADAPRALRFDTYMEEAMYERMVPGEGELPLADLLAEVPDGVVISIEIPIRSWAEQGIGARERTARCVAGAKVLLGRGD